MLLERLRRQAEENASVSSALDAAMLECASFQESANECLNVSNATVASPMYVAEDNRIVKDNDALLER